MASSTLEHVSIQSKPESMGGSNIHKESTGRHRHSSQQSRSQTLPEASQTLSGIGLLEAVGHALELLLGTKAITLHLTLDHIEGVAAQPEGLTGQTTVRSDLQTGDILTLDVVALGVLVHQELESQEPHTVCLRLTEVGNVLATEKTLQHTFVGGELADAVDGAVVETASAVGLRLQTDTDVLDRSRENGVGQTGETTGHVVLAVRKSAIGVLLLVQLLKASPGFVESTKLHTDLQGISMGSTSALILGTLTYTGTDSDQRGQGTLVESQGTLVLEDLLGAVEGARVLRSRLQPHLDNI